MCDNGLFLSCDARYFPPRRLDSENRRLRLGHGQVPMERLPTSRAAQWIHFVDGRLTAFIFLLLPNYDPGMVPVT